MKKLVSDFVMIVTGGTSGEKKKKRVFWGKKSKDLGDEL